MSHRRTFIKTHVLQLSYSSSNISKILPHQSKPPLRIPFSTHQTVAGKSDEPLSPSLLHDRSALNNEGEKRNSLRANSTSSTRQEISNLRRGQSKRSTRTYPVRKQFILESYLDLFTSNEVCLLFRHHALSSRQWNSIRGQIKNLSAPSTSTETFGEIKFTEEDEAARLSKPVPQIQVLRTKMILPVLKKLLKDAKIEKDIYNSLVYSRHPLSSSSPNQIKKDQKKIIQLGPTHLTGSLFSITQPRFEPDQIKKVIKILNDYSVPDGPEKQRNEKDEKSSKIQFLIGLIAQKKICQDQQELEKLSNLNSLESLRCQIISLINSPVQNLISSLNFARASNLIFTLNSHIKTQQHDRSIPSTNQSSDSQPSS